jgi:hypothetical protein
MNIMKNRKEDVIFVAVLLALVLVFILFKVTKGEKAEAPLVDDVPVDQIVPDLKPIKKPIIVKKEKPATIWPELSYSEEFARYRDGRLVQFDMNCGVLRSRMAIANGSSMMLDNRSNKEQLITIGDQKFTLTPFDFEIFTIKASEIPTTYLIDCNERQNVATLLVE